MIICSQVFSCPSIVASSLQHSVVAVATVCPVHHKSVRSFQFKRAFKRIVYDPRVAYGVFYDEALRPMVVVGERGSRTRGGVVVSHRNLWRAPNIDSATNKRPPATATTSRTAQQTRAARATNHKTREREREREQRVKEKSITSTCGQVLPL